MGPGLPWSPEAPPKAYSLTFGCPVWRLLGSQLGASPEPEPLGYGGLSHLRPCTSIPCLALWLRTCPFSWGRGGCPALPLLKARLPAAAAPCAVSSTAFPPLGVCALAASALSRSSAEAVGRRGCPGWPLAQQCPTPLPTAA